MVVDLNINLMTSVAAGCVCVLSKRVSGIEIEENKIFWELQSGFDDSELILSISIQIMLAYSSSLVAVKIFSSKNIEIKTRT